MLARIETGVGPPAVSEAIGFLRERLSRAPRAVLVLGSGLGEVAAEIEDPVRVPYEEIPGFPAAVVPGHRGELVAGIWEGVELVALSGRFHLYEGWDPVAVALPLRALAALGADRLILTNAAGGVRRDMGAGELMLIVDHLNFMFRNPLVGAAAPGEARFPDMSSPYDAEFRRIALETAAKLGITLTRGVYAGVLGPSYETVAEIRMLAAMGADAVGMSTVPEVIVARALGLRVLGISCITNPAAGLGVGRLDHEEVLEVAGAAGYRLRRLLAGLVPKLVAANLPTEAVE
ncbi:MAG: purine-nucleoside phosphorylase [Gemmatimonadota bacterium]